MGYLSKANAIEAYRQIRRSAVGRVCSILILAAPTVDALCALKILTVPSASCGHAHGGCV